jgi:hypothetical protein
MGTHQVLPSMRNGVPSLRDTLIDTYLVDDVNIAIPKTVHAIMSMRLVFKAVSTLTALVLTRCP